MSTSYICMYDAIYPWTVLTILSLSLSLYLSLLIHRHESMHVHVAYSCTCSHVRRCAWVGTGMVSLVYGYLCKHFHNFTYYCGGQKVFKYKCNMHAYYVHICTCTYMYMYMYNVCLVGYIQTVYSHKPSSKIMHGLVVLTFILAATVCTCTCTYLYWVVYAAYC